MISFCYLDVASVLLGCARVKLAALAVLLPVVFSTTMLVPALPVVFFAGGFPARRGVEMKYGQTERAEPIGVELACLQNT